LPEERQTEVIVIDRDDLSAVREIAAANDVELTALPISAFEPITTIALLLTGSALAISTVSYLIDKRKGGQVIDLRPGTPKPFYRTSDVVYGLVLIVAMDGTVTVEVKEPKGMFGVVVEALQGMTANLAEVSIEAIAELAKSRLAGKAVIGTHPLTSPPSRA
jgi:hypothetical protein